MAQFSKGIVIYLNKQIKSKNPVYLMCEGVQSASRYCNNIIDRGPSIKYVTLFLANFYPPYPCHTSSHIPGPPKVRHTSQTPFPISIRPSTKNPDKSPLVQILFQLFAGFLSGGFVGGSFVWKVLCWMVFVRSRSVRIHLLLQKVKHHFKFHIS